MPSVEVGEVRVDTNDALPPMEVGGGTTNHGEGEGVPLTESVRQGSREKEEGSGNELEGAQTGTLAGHITLFSSDDDDQEAATPQSVNSTSSGRNLHAGSASGLMKWLALQERHESDDSADSLSSVVDSANKTPRRGKRTSRNETPVNEVSGVA